MSKLKKQNDMRINLSSFEKKCNLKKYIKFNPKNILNPNIKINNDKIINLNTFEPELNKKKIKYSTCYTNPYSVIPKYIANINFNKTNNKKIINLCTKLFIDGKNNLDEYDFKEFNILLIKKNKPYDKYIGIEQTFLILWYLVFSDKHIEYADKLVYMDMIKLYYTSFCLGTFDIAQIIYGLANSENVLQKKFYVSFYVLAEEFHFKYINLYLGSNKKSNIIFNSNYIKINPQKLLNNLDGEFKYCIETINEEITCPFGHNILIIKSNQNKIYYYDPDEQILSDFYKLKILFKSAELDFLNISNRNPIQTITDDSNCVFYCLGLIKYIFENNIQINLARLKLATLFYESEILSTGQNIFDYTIKMPI